MRKLGETLNPFVSPQVSSGVRQIKATLGVQKSEIKGRIQWVSNVKFKVGFKP